MKECDYMNWFAFWGVWFPIICFISGIILLVYSVWRKKKQLTCMKFIMSAMVLMFIAIIPTMVLVLAFISGIGPVPN